jgi:hypothetical protein
VTKKLKVFVHVLGSGGQLVAQDDGLPALWTYNTDAWQVGETVVDFHQVVWEQTSGSPPYTIQVGLYTEEEGRVPVTSPAGVDDSLRLETFRLDDEG